MILLDSHCDAPSQMLRLRDYCKDNPHAQVDFPKMKRGGVDASFFALYIPASLGPKEASEYAFKLLDETDRQVAAATGTVAYATTAEEVKENQRKGLISILLGLENASAIQHDMELLHEFYKRGVRYVTLTHSADNQICDSCTGRGTWGGLSPFGRDLVREMNRIGMLVDVAHCADSTIREVLEVSDSPVVYTHGCCRALASHKRNLSDELLRSIARSGGVVGMSIYPCFLSDDFCTTLENSGLLKKSKVEEAFIQDPASEKKRAAWEKLQDSLAALPRPGVSLVVDHIEHAIDVCGIEHVGIGTDYDGIEVTAAGLEDISRLGLTLDVLHGRGYRNSEVELVAGENFLRLL